MKSVKMQASANTSIALTGCRRTAVIVFQRLAQIQYLEKATDVPLACSVSYSRSCTSTFQPQQQKSEQIKLVLANVLLQLLAEWAAVWFVRQVNNEWGAFSATVEGAYLVFSSRWHTYSVTWMSTDCLINRMCCILACVHTCWLVASRRLFKV